MITPRARVGFRDVISVLRRHAWLVCGTAILGAALATYAVLRGPLLYRATAVVRLVDARRSITQGIENHDGDRAESVNPLLSRIQFLKSRLLIGRVVDAEGLRLRSATPGFPTRLLDRVRIEPEVVRDTFFFRFSDDAVTVRNGAHETRVGYGAPYSIPGLSFVVASKPDVESATLILWPREETIDWLIENLRVSPRAETDVVDVSYVSPGADVAQRVVNRLVTTFQDANIRAAQAQSRRRRVFLEEQLQEITGQMRSAEHALTSFRSREQVFSSRDKLQAEQAALMALDMRREELDADRRLYNSLLTKLQAPLSETRSEELRALIAAPDLSSNQVVGQLYQQLAQYQTTRDSLTTGEWRSADSNPDVVRIDQLIKGYGQRLESAVRGHITTLDARLDALGALRSRRATAVEALPRTESTEEQLVRQVDANRQMADRLREEYQKARMAEVVEVGQVEVMDLAALPYRPVGRMAYLKVIVGLLLGLAAGTVAALLVEGAGGGDIRRRVDLEEDMRVRVLSVIPRIDTASMADGSRVKLAKRLLGERTSESDTSGESRGRAQGVVPMSPAGSEAFRLLRSSLKWTQGAEAAKTLVVTSSLPEEGKSTTAANLAAAYAMEGRRTLLIDCDLRRPRLHRVFRVPRDPGVAQVLSDQLTAASAIRHTFIEALSFLPAGHSITSGADLLGSARMGDLLGDLSKHFDAIVLDTPPVLAVADAVSLAALADSVLLVVRAGDTDRRAVEQTLQRLASVGARVVGAVLNDSRGEVARHEEYAYAQSYTATYDLSAAR